MVLHYLDQQTLAPWMWAPILAVDSEDPSRLCSRWFAVGCYSIGLCWGWMSVSKMFQVGQVFLVAIPGEVTMSPSYRSTLC